MADEEKAVGKRGVGQQQGGGATRELGAGLREVARQTNQHQVNLLPGF